MHDARSLVTNPAGRNRVSSALRIGIAVHHSVSGDRLGVAAPVADELAHIRAIDAYHVGLGYGGFGYHAAVFASGRAYLCGDLEGQRAHVAGRNHELLGVVLIGTFTDRQPDRVQLVGLAEVLNMFEDHIGRRVPIRGHGSWALPGEATGCPGRVAEIDFGLLEGEDMGDTFHRAGGLANEGFFHGLEVAGEQAIWTASPVPGDWNVPLEAQSILVTVYLAGGELDLVDGDGGKAGFCYGRATTFRVFPGADLHRSIRLDGNAIIDKLELLGYYT